MDKVIVEKVSKIYSVGKVKVEALKNVSFEIDKNEFISLVGPSGSGKSTLIYLIGALDKPSTGRINVFGVDISSLKNSQATKWRRKNVGIIFQFFHLIPTLTAIENVVLSAELAGISKRERVKRARELLEFVGLGDKMDRFPSELSGGEQQRVAIARALAGDPQLILADEPTANLDYPNKIRIVELLNRAKELGKTVIFATHDIELAKYSDRIISIRDGKIVEG
ncbi:TPA: ABC transporter ATP-binding protein [Candidatus Geothermarchaeota archaeon]|nr:ABC transporter ATP-binding protein [Candidatus Geothermarchaeota archaeon]HIQ13305.1 ABC transporter ATP-binding protein [Thermoprotei archaeon]